VGEQRDEVFQGAGAPFSEPLLASRSTCSCWPIEGVQEGVAGAGGNVWNITGERIRAQVSQLIRAFPGLAAGQTKGGYFYWLVTPLGQITTPSCLTRYTHHTSCPLQTAGPAATDTWCCQKTWAGRVSPVAFRQQPHWFLIRPAATPICSSVSWLDRHQHIVRRTRAKPVVRRLQRPQQQGCACAGWW
jgi:hypothetical protein